MNCSGLWGKPESSLGEGDVRVLYTHLCSTSCMCCTHICVVHIMCMCCTHICVVYIMCVCCTHICVVYMISCVCVVHTSV